MTAPTQHFGPRVLGKEEYERQTAAVKAHQNRGIGLGKRVTEPSPSPRAAREAAARLRAEIPSEIPSEPETGGVTVEEPPPVPEAAPEPQAPAPEAPPASTVLSIRQMEQALEENGSVELFDRLFGEEMERAEPGPRKGALQLLLAAEQRRTEPRPAVVAELQQHLQSR